MATVRILVSRHSAFYSPLIATIAGGFLAREGCNASYGVLPPGCTSRGLIRADIVDVIQSAVSSSFGPLAKGEKDLPPHILQINVRDGFFLVARRPDPDFQWTKLGGATVLADHAGQPLAMLKYAARHNGVDWESVQALDRGSPEDMEKAFRAGVGDYVHLQSPAAHQLVHDGIGTIAASVGGSMPAVAFSSLVASREFSTYASGRAFIRAYAAARAWVREAPPEEVAHAEAPFFGQTPLPVLTAAIAAYQKLGCWNGGVTIPRELFNQALRVFGANHAYEEVCSLPVTSGT